MIPHIHEIIKLLGIFVENITVLCDGNILISTLDSPELLYKINPRIEDPVAVPVANFADSTNVTGLSGIVQLGNDLVAVSGGVHAPFSFVKGTMNLYIVSLATDKIIDSIPVPDTTSMNGLAMWPGCPDKLVSADSNGRLLLINIATREVDVLLDDMNGLGFARCPPGVLKIGINGIRAHGKYFYFINSCLGTFARIDTTMESFCIEVLAVVSDPTKGQIPDDFTFDRQGNAYVAVHPGSVIKVSPDGSTELIAGTMDEDTSSLKHPTSAALSNDGQSIYVSTGGPFKDKTSGGGQVVQIGIS